MTATMRYWPTRNGTRYGLDARRDPFMDSLRRRTRRGRPVEPLLLDVLDDRGPARRY